MKLVFFNMLFEMGTLGLPNLITHLERNGYPSDQVYLTKSEQETDREVDSILSFIERRQPDLIGFSLMTYNFYRTRKLTGEIKKRFPHVPVLWGGIHPTLNPDESIEHADYICVGEGEDAVLEFLQAFEKGEPDRDIPNIWRKRNGSVFRNDVRPLIQNLDDYPFPRMNWDRNFCLDEGEIAPLTHELYQKYVDYKGKMYDIIISRGCPYACAYCCSSAFKELYRGKGRFLRYRTVDNVIPELKYAQEAFPFINMVNIQDDGFASAPTEYLREFSEKYRREIGLPLRLRIIPTMMDETKMQYLEDANTLVAVMGLQGSDRINRDYYNRNVPSEEFIEVAKMIRRHNIVGQYDLITRNPYATEEDMLQICDILSRLPKPYKLETMKLALYPNTPLRQRAIQDGIPVNETDGYTTRFGSYPEKFPHLRDVQEVCQYTPKFLVDFFVSTRNSRAGRALFRAYLRVVYKNIHRLRAAILRNTTLVTWTKKLVFLPITVLRSIRSLFKK